jgi:hypothetical protein
MVSHCKAYKHQSLMQTLHNSVPGPTFSDKAVFTLSEMATVKAKITDLCQLLYLAVFSSHGKCCKHRHCALCAIL